MHRCKKILLSGITIFIVIGFLVSCDEFCEESNRTAVVVNFYSSADGSVLKDTITIKSIGNETTMYPVENNQAVAFSTVLCQLNPGSDTSRIIFQYRDEKPDTLIFTYTRDVGFISSECGCVTYYNLLDIEYLKKSPDSVSNTIDSIRIVNPDISTVSYRENVINPENIRIYY